MSLHPETKGRFGRAVRDLIHKRELAAQQSRHRHPALYFTRSGSSRGINRGCYLFLQTRHSNLHLC